MSLENETGQRNQDQATSEETAVKTLDEIHQEILGILLEKVIDQIRKTHKEDISFLNQTYGDVADQVITASIDRELVETLYGPTVANELWGPDSPDQ